MPARIGIILAMEAWEGGQGGWRGKLISTTTVQNKKEMSIKTCNDNYSYLFLSFVPRIHQKSMKSDYP